MSSKHTTQELRELQALPLHLKIRLTKQRIREWINYYGEDGVYISFSGGKDSTVLLDLVREDHPNVAAVFVDTGLEYPEIREFVKTFENVVWLKPKMNFRQVIEKYGYPFVSKEVSESVYGAKRYLTKILEENNAPDRQTLRTAITTGNLLEQANTQSLRLMTPGGVITSTEKLEDLANILNDRMQNRKGGANQRLAILLGMLTQDGQIKANIPEKDRSQFAQTKWQFLLTSPFEISNKCCNVMKKSPLHSFTKQTDMYGMTAQMASESRLRTQKWLQKGCNAFDAVHPISNPMSFWTEQDVLLYIYLYKLPIASVYGEVVPDTDADYKDIVTSEAMSWMSVTGIFDLERPSFKTTGCNRTGCIFCGFGCHLEKEGEGRFERLKVTHPKLYEYIMKPWDEGGLGYKEVIDWLNENGNLHIRY